MIYRIIYIYIYIYKLLHRSLLEILLKRQLICNLSFGVIRTQAHVYMTIAPAL